MALGEASGASISGASGDIYVLSAGAGDVPLIAITPIGARWLVEALPQAFAEMFTVHVVELPGTGRSGGDPAAQSVASVARAVADVAAQVTRGRDRPLLFGHSMNGTLALAATNGANVAGVITVGAPPRLPGDPAARPLYTQFWDANADPLRRERAAALLAEYEAADRDDAKAEIASRHALLSQWFDMDLDRSALEDLAVMPGDWIAAMFGDAASIDWDATLRAVEAPVLLAQGAYDFVSPPTLWTDVAAPPKSTVSTFARSAHNAFVEQPDDFVVAVREWLRTI